MATKDERPAGPPASACPDGQVLVLVASDRMSADLLVTAPIEGGKPATVEDALRRLEENGVVFGIDMAAVERAVAEAASPRDPSTPVEQVRVAQGRPPGMGEDARIDYHPILTAVSGRPKERADGTVDLFDLGLVHNVAKGTVLAVMIPPTRGEPGMTVTGLEIPGRMGREVWLKAGSGTTLSEDRLTVTAAVDGHAALLYGEVAVTNVFQVNKDIAVETGNIQFVGSVVVRGSVLHGFSVKAEGDVEVYGSVTGGTVEAAGNVTVQYGIVGAGHGKVVAGGSVRARFMEGADVKAGGNVWAAEGILQSRVEAGGAVEVMGRRGAIIGGQVIAKNSVSARNIGSEMGAPTHITVGILPELRQEMQEVQKALAVAEQDFQRADQMVQFLAAQSRHGNLCQEKRATLAKLVKAQEQLFARQEELKARRQELEQMAREARGAWVHAKDTCFPGVRITLGSSHLLVTEKLQRVRFRLGPNLDVEAEPA